MMEDELPYAGAVAELLPRRRILTQLSLAMQATVTLRGLSDHLSLRNVWLSCYSDLSAIWYCVR